MRLIYPEMVQHRNNVVACMRLRVARAVFRHVGGRKAARVEGDAAEVAREKAQLRLPAAVIAGEFVHEHERRAAAGLLEIQAGAGLCRGGRPEALLWGETRGGGCPCGTPAPAGPPPPPWGAAAA